MGRRVALGLIIGVITLALALYGVPLGELYDALAAMDKRWLLPVALVFLGQQALRSLRQMLIVRAVVPGSSFRGNFAVLCMSFFCINVLPARLGEVVRPTLLMQREGVPLGAGFGVVFVERLVDLVAVLVVLQLVLMGVAIPSRLVPFGDGSLDIAAVGQDLGSLLVLPLLVGLVGLLVLGDRAVGIAQRASASLLGSLPEGRVRSLAARISGAILGLAGGFVTGLAAVRQPARIAAIAGLTALTWSGTGFMYVMLAHAFGLEDLIGWGQGMGVLVITMLGTMVPAPPGFAGVYEAACRGALALFGVHGPGLDAKALAFALVVHWWIFLVQSATASYFFSTEGVSIAALWRQSRGAVGPPPTGDAGESRTPAGPSP